MAKRRKKSRKVSTRRRAFFRPKKSRRSSSKGGTMATMFGAGLYGAARARVSNSLSPITARIPLGGIADEAVMLGVSWALWKGKVPILNKLDIAKKAGMAGFIVESARIGEFIGTQGFGGMTTTAKPQVFGPTVI